MLPTLLEHNHLTLLRRWLFSAVFALAVAGLFSLPPVILRGSFFQGLFDTQHVFDVALIIHVNLSVLVWMLMIGGMLLSIHIPKSMLFIARISWLLCFIGMLAMMLSAFFPSALPIKSNYIPILLHPLFTTGLSFFATGFLLICGLHLLFTKSSSAFLFQLNTTAFTTFIAFACFILSGHVSNVNPFYDPLLFYEQLFWGGGHILQFTFVHIMLIAWLELARHATVHPLLSDKAINILFIINLLLTIPTPLIYIYTTDTSEHSWLFTQHMRYVGGIIPSIIGIAILIPALRRLKLPKVSSKFKAFQEGQEYKPYLYSSLIYSLLFFAYGGLLALLIRGMDTTVPAHYHASVVGGISIALMGLCYTLLPQLKLPTPHLRLARLQPHIYTLGHFLHVTGLAIMGGYGALRKTAGNTGQVDTLIGKALFFSGGPLALLGGLLFIIIMIISFKNSLSSTKTSLP